MYLRRRPFNNDTEARLMERLATQGHILVVDVTPEERAMLTVMVARGSARLEGTRYVPVVMG